MELYGTGMSHSQSAMSGMERSPPTWSKQAASHCSSTPSSHHSRLRSQNSKDWEVVDDHQLEMTMAFGENPKDPLMAPGICQGYLHKRKKRPLKGWHKRYFVLETGILRYGKTQHETSRGRLRGSLDVSLAVMSINKKSRRIELDAGDILYHMKAKNHELFFIWVTKLNAHRLFKKNEASQVHNGILQLLTLGPSGEDHRDGDMAVYPHSQSLSGSQPGEVGLEVLPGPAANPGVNGKVSAWLQQSHDPDIAAQELLRCQGDLSELNRLVQRLQTLELGPTFTNGDLQRIISMQNLSLEKPKKSRCSKKWGHSRTLSRGESLGMLSSNHFSTANQMGASVPSIPDYVYSQLAPPNIVSPECKKIQQDICTVSQRVHASLKSVHEALTQEHLRLQESWRSPDPLQSTPLPEGRRCSQQAPSVVESTAEYFDASDEFPGDSSSEVSEESSLSDTSSNSEPEEGHGRATLAYRASISKSPGNVLPRNTGRRTTLPAHCPDNSHVGLMQILYNNIGKDLSRISMPAALNEPINLLQRLCEELEYSNLLDIASETQDPYQRMVYIAAFAISGYAPAYYRNRYKPFNPVLGETYECYREDRGFHYISEQVSHHPPISACHAESDNFTFWQDQRWKNKFWGKSLEIVPTGMVNVTLPKFGDHYEWNKVVTCIHNVLSQQRYLEHYGEITIRNLNDSICTCKITFVKSRYWGSITNKNEVNGSVLDESGSVIHRFGGLWHEGIFCDTLPTPQCIWKPNPQPEDYLLYYGFSTFALELNELPPELLPFLPPTDSRLRPDQRMLEEGHIEECDAKKEEVEEMQRERRNKLARRGMEHIPRFFKKTKDHAGGDVWITNNTYWKIRKNPGFAKIPDMDLW